MRIDFAFFDSRQRLCVAGWSNDPDLQMTLAIDGVRRPLAWLRRFVRRDLTSEEELGVLAVFERADGLDLSPEAELALIVAGESVHVDMARTAEDERNLVRASVDEVFAAYLREIGARHLAAPAREISGLILSRVQANLRPLPAETTSLALNIDRLLVAPSGIGVLFGWCMTVRQMTHPIRALVSDGRSLRPVHLLTEILPREDLAGYRDRFRFTGMDGFVGVFRLPDGLDRDARVIVIGNAGKTPLVFGRSAEAVSDTVAAEALCEIRDLLADPDLDREVLRGILPRNIAARFDPPEPPAAPAAIAGPTTLLIDIDVDAASLRDVIRRCAARLGRPLQILPVSGDVTQPQRAALQAAVAEAGAGVSLSPPVDLRALLARDFAPHDPVVYGSASALFQMTPAALRPGRATMVVHDPVGAIGRGGDLAAPGGNPGAAPFLLTVAGGLLAAALRSDGTGPITAHGTISAALDCFDRHGLVDALRAPVTTFYPGTGMAAGRSSPRSLDADLLAVLRHEREAAA